LEPLGSLLGAFLGFCSHDNKPEVLKYVEHSAKNCNKYSAALDGEQFHLFSFILELLAAVLPNQH
jgi:hypothetical protein